VIDQAEIGQCGRPPSR